MVKKILTYSLIAAVLAVVWLTISLDKEKADKERYKANQEALLNDIKQYKTESGKNAASVERLTLTYGELKKNYDDVVKTVKDLGLKVGRVQTVTQTRTETQVEVVTQVRDSIVYVKGEPIKTMAFDWKDAWTKVDGYIHNDSVNMHVQSCDTLTTVAHRVPHKFWFIKWGTKAIRQEVVSSNPHTKIVYQKYIELKK